MNENISDLLPLVSDDLRAKYEEKNGLTQTLKWANAEYEIAQKASDAMWKKTAILRVLELFLLVIMVLIGVAAIIGAAPGYVAFGAAIILTLVVTYNMYLHMQDGQHCATRAKLRPILLDFRQAVEALVPYKMMDNSVVVKYTEGLIRQGLVGTAFNLLTAEKNTNEVRLNMSLASYVVLQNCNIEVGCRERFNNALAASEKFGLIFSTADVFREAKRFIP